MSKATWDQKLLGLAKHVAGWSKDPSTKCGAVIADPATNRVRGLGYNGFPMGMADTEERLTNREDKYSRVVHAEMNAREAAMTSVQGCTMYIWPFPSCNRCAVQIIQSGIKRVVFPYPPADKLDRWKESLDTAVSYYDECGVEVKFLDLIEPG